MVVDAITDEKDIPAGGVVGAFAGYQVRTELVRALTVSDFVIAVIEDLVAVAGALFFATRF